MCDGDVWLGAEAVLTHPSHLVAIHLHAVAFSNDDPIKKIVSIYRLTKREQEALRGIALGLTTKELAERMQVSPNTVKSFVRLITVKMGVSSRAEIMVRPRRRPS